MEWVSCSRQLGFNTWGALEDTVEQSSKWTPTHTTGIHPWGYSLANMSSLSFPSG